MCDQLLELFGHTPDDLQRAIWGDPAPLGASRGTDTPPRRLHFAGVLSSLPRADSAALCLLVRQQFLGNRGACGLDALDLAARSVRALRTFAPGYREGATLDQLVRRSAGKRLLTALQQPGAAGIELCAQGAVFALVGHLEFPDEMRICTLLRVGFQVL